MLKSPKVLSMNQVRIQGGAIAASYKSQLWVWFCAGGEWRKYQPWGVQEDTGSCRHKTPRVFSQISVSWDSQFGNLALCSMAKPLACFSCLPAARATPTEMFLCNM